MFHHLLIYQQAQVLQIHYHLYEQTNQHLLTLNKPSLINDGKSAAFLTLRQTEVAILTGF